MGQEYDNDGQFQDAKDEVDSSKTSTSSEMMDMSECPGVISSAGKEFASESNNFSQSKKSGKTNAQKVLHGPNHSIQTYGQQAHPRLMPSSGQPGRKQVDSQKMQILKRTQEFINFPTKQHTL